MRGSQNSLEVASIDRHSLRQWLVSGTVVHRSASMARTPHTRHPGTSLLLECTSPSPPTICSARALVAGILGWRLGGAAAAREAALS